MADSDDLDNIDFSHIVHEIITENPSLASGDRKIVIFLSDTWKYLEISPCLCDCFSEAYCSGWTSAF